jgi:hypothetical protein
MYKLSSTIQNLYLLATKSVSLAIAAICEETGQQLVSCKNNN